MLYTTKQIAEMYSSSESEVTPYMITQTWIKNGLKYIKGKGHAYLYKKEWVEEYLEKNAIQNMVTFDFQENSKSRFKKNNMCKVLWKE